MIIAAEREQKRELNEEQTLLFALLVDTLETAFKKRPNEEEPWLPTDAWLFDIIVDGGGGCGKTMLINYFIVPLWRHGSRPGRAQQQSRPWNRRENNA